MDDNTVEALREVLQDMTSAIELISSGERSGAALIHFIEEMLKTIESWAVKYNVFLDDGSLAINSAQGSQPNSYPNTNPQVQEVMDSLNVDQVNDMADPSTRQHSGEGEAEIGGEHVAHFQNDGTERDGRQAIPPQIDNSSGIAASVARRVSRKTRSQAASMREDVTPTDDGEVKTPQAGKSLKPEEAASGDESSEGQVDVTESPSWLPEGWITEVKSRGIGSNAGSKYKFYVDPSSNHRFRSKKEVLAFLGTTKRKRGRPRKKESLKDDSPRHTNDATQAGNVYESVVGSNPEVQSPSNPSPSNNMVSQGTTSGGVDTIKRKRGRPRKVDSVKVDSVKNLAEITDHQHTNASSQAGGEIPESVVSSNIIQQTPSSSSPTTNDTQPHFAASSLPTSTGPMNNCIPLPHQSGQPSEWLVYESLASLPFPMFEHLRFVENNANKLATNNNSPPNLWPWMLGNSEGLKKPFTDIKLNESKPVEENKQDETAPISSSAETQADEVVPKRPKKAARKNAS